MMLSVISYKTQLIKIAIGVLESHTDHQQEFSFSVRYEIYIFIFLEECACVMVWETTTSTHNNKQTPERQNHWRT